jgi:hypothetical protein
VAGVDKRLISTTNDSIDVDPYDLSNSSRPQLTNAAGINVAVTVTIAGDGSTDTGPDACTTLGAADGYFGYINASSVAKIITIHEVSQYSTDCYLLDS